MFKLFANGRFIREVFSRYSMKEAIQVKEHISDVFTELTLPSNELLAKMKREGLDLTPEPCKKSNSWNTESSPSILKSHMQSLFLDYEKLKAVFKSFSVVEALAVKECIEQHFEQLKLPSEALLASMQKEGISIQSLGLSKLAPQQSSSLDSTKACLSKALTLSQEKSSKDQSLGLYQTGNNPQSAQLEDVRKTLGSALAKGQDDIGSELVDISIERARNTLKKALQDNAELQQTAEVTVFRKIK